MTTGYAIKQQLYTSKTIHSDEYTNPGVSIMLGQLADYADSLSKHLKDTDMTADELRAFYRHRFNEFAVDMSGIYGLNEDELDIVQGAILTATA